MNLGSIRLFFSTLLLLASLSTTAWGALDGTSWLLDVKAGLTAGKAGSIKVTEPYAIDFSAGGFAVKSVEDETLGFTGTYEEITGGKTTMAPVTEELVTYITKKIEAAAILKGHDVFVSNVVIKKVSSTTKFTQDWADLHLNLGLSVSYSYTGTLDGQALAASGSLVINAKGILADEGLSDLLPQTTWNFATKEVGSLQGVGSYSDPGNMTIEFGAGNDVSIISGYYGVTINGTYTLDDTKKKINMSLSPTDLTNFLTKVIQNKTAEKVGLDTSNVSLSDLVFTAQASFSGGTMKFTGKADFVASALFYGIPKSGKGKFTITAAGVKVTP